MAKTKKTDIEGKSIEALREDVKAKRQELFNARLDLVKGKLKNTRSITNIRHDIARMLTKMSEEAKQMKKEVANG